jgi:hypothetical protein
MTYAKAFAAVIAAALVAVSAVITDGISTTEWITVAIAAVGAAAVFAAPNVPGAKYTKSILAVLTAVLAFVATTVADGLGAADLVQIGILALGALGIYAVPNLEAGVNISDTGSLGEPA